MNPDTSQGGMVYNPNKPESRQMFYDAIEGVFSWVQKLETKLRDNAYTDWHTWESKVLEVTIETNLYRSNIPSENFCRITISDVPRFIADSFIEYVDLCYGASVWGVKRMPLGDVYTTYLEEKRSELELSFTTGKDVDFHVTAKGTIHNLELGDLTFNLMPFPLREV